MSFLQLLVVAIVQGLTEFLPISSSAHLILVPYFTDWPDQGPQIDVAVHVGTLVAVLLYFRSDVVDMLVGTGQLIRGRWTPGARLALMLAIGTIPVVICGLAVKLVHLDEAMRTPAVLAWATIGFGIVLYAADRFCRSIHGIEQFGLKAAILIGLAQAIALIPGTSRSGITITAARALGFQRTEAARISMLLSIPTILAAGLLTGYDLYKEGSLALGEDAAIGAGLSCISALLALSVMMRWLRHATYAPFVIYRVLLGAGLLYWIYG